jgi:hypothetical protein
MNISIALKEAWSAACHAYGNGQVNSECTLHSLMYAELRGRLLTCAVLCEPQMTVERHGCFVPDLVGLEGSTVAAIVRSSSFPTTTQSMNLIFRNSRFSLNAGRASNFS